MVSAYLNSEHDIGTKTVKSGPSQNRLTKFTIFDGVNQYEAMEYEMLNMVHDFNVNGIILALKPPIMVKKGMFLLKKQNVKVLY